MCPVFCNTRNGLIKHLFKKHRNEPNFIVHSAFEGCGASFRTDDSFRMHCSRKHLAEELNNTNGTVEDDAMRESMDTQYLLKLRAGHSLSQAAIQDIVMSTRSLFSDTGRLDMIKDKIINALLLEMQNDVDFNKLFSDSLFNGLETEYLQDKFLEENMRYVEPLPVKLGTINKQVKKWTVPVS